MATVPISPERFHELAQQIEAEVGKVIVGQRDIIRQTLISILLGRHTLLEGVPGLGKTLLIRTFAQVLQLQFNRIQFTPDLMPSDIVGTDILTETEEGRREFRFQAGPIFANLVLADEINRATPKTQSAMLEVMQEKSVTVGGKTYTLALPFFVLATQNPIEQEGTYPLPEAQLDRFIFKLNLTPPNVSELITIMERTTHPKRGDRRAWGRLDRHERAGARCTCSQTRHRICRPFDRLHPSQPSRKHPTHQTVRALWCLSAWWASNHLGGEGNRFDGWAV